MKECPKCKAKADDDDIYCPECGTKLKTIKKETAKETGTRKITIRSIMKAIGIVVLLVILTNIFKNLVPAIIVVFLLLLWLNVINKLLTKMFNIELSLGVKILITIIIIFLSFMAASTMTSAPQAFRSPQTFESPREFIETKQAEFIQENDMVNTIKELEKVLREGDMGYLKGLLVSGKISKEVFLDLEIILFEKGSINIIFEIKSKDTQLITEKGIQGNSAMFEIKRILMYEDDSRASDMSKWKLEKYDGTWQIVFMEPPLSQLVFSGRGALSIKALPMCQEGTCLSPSKTAVQFENLRKI